MVRMENELKGYMVQVFIAVVQPKQQLEYLVDRIDRNSEQFKQVTLRRSVLLFSQLKRGGR